MSVSTTTTSSPRGSRDPRFPRSKGLATTLQTRVREYFTDNNLSENDSPTLYVKAAIIMIWLISSYLLLVFLPMPLWARILTMFSLALAIAGAGFNIQHDGGHRAFSKHQWINRLTARCLDILGGSSYLWDKKHNHFHHKFPNVPEYDEDHYMGPLGRLEPSQDWYWWHRFQHLYIWLLYGFISIKWQLFDDFSKAVRSKIGTQPIDPIRGWDLVVFVVGKILFLTLAFVVPALFNPFSQVLLTYVIVSIISGIIMAVVFQLAHCVEDAEFPQPSSELMMPDEFFGHQLITTMDFAPNNWLLNWYAGGLNWQVIHHLFPRICHIHYPKIAHIIRETAAEFGFPYNSAQTFRAALASHYRHLKAMGQKPVQTS